MTGCAWTAERQREYMRVWLAANLDAKRAADRRYAAEHAEYARAKTAAWAKANPERKRATDAAYREANKDRLREAQKAWRLANADRLRAAKSLAKRSDEGRAANLAWKKANPGKVNAANAKPKAMRRRAMPAWLNESERGYMQAVYIGASDLGLHVDHIVPICHPLVCGLHVPWNLQMLTPAANIAKGNFFEVG